MFKRRGEITPIKNLFSKYQHTLVAPQKTVEMEVIRVVGELTGLSLKESQVSYTVSSRTVALTAPALLKQEIRLRQSDILKELKRRLGKKSSPEHFLC